MKIMYIKLLILCLLVATLSLHGKPEHFAKKVKSTRSITEQDVFDLGRSIVQFPWIIATLAHECGHAIAAKILTGTPIDIHMGAQPDSAVAKKKLARVGCLTLDNFKGGGYSYIGYPEKKHQIPIMAAGPAMGIVSLAGMRMLLNSWPESIYLTPYKAFLLALIDSKLLFQALYGFTPMYNKTADGDGAMIWQLMGANEKTIKTISTIDKKGRLLKLPYIYHALSALHKMFN